MERLKRLQKVLQAEHPGIDCLVVSDAVNRKYLSGFSGSSGYLMVSQTAALLLTDFRYLDQAGTEAKDFEIVEFKTKAAETIKEQAGRAGWHRLGFESEALTYQDYQALQEVVGETVALLPMSGIVRKLRMVKEPAEIVSLRKAIEIADAGFTYLLTILRPGITEQKIAWELEKYLRENQAEGMAFATIIASGHRGALPHGMASDKILSAGDLVVMDFGAVYRGYHSDLTRTVAVGQADAKAREIYQLVLEAQMAAIAAAKPGLTAQQLDAVARGIIEAAGFGAHFGHGLGHGVGLEVHEIPRVGPRSEELLQERMTFTIEPGIYLSGWGGVRIEDVVLTTPQGCQVLTAAPKELIIV